MNLMGNEKPEHGKLLRLLGLARKAGALVYGYEAVKSDIARKRGLLILTACDLSENSKKDLLKFIENTGVHINTDLSVTKEEIGWTIGAKPTGIISINNENFKKGILEVISFENKKEDNRIGERV
jgi:ribosomal protein L7Ae-like RNA K-turn-binding protein